MTPAVASGERFPRRARLRSTREIRGVFRDGRRRVAGPLEIFVRRSGADRPRVGVVVPRHGHTVVERNRLRRRLREVLRRDWLPGAVEAGRAVDVVVRARPGAYDATFRSLRASLLEGLDEITWPDGSSSP